MRNCATVAFLAVPFGQISLKSVHSTFLLVDVAICTGAQLVSGLHASISSHISAGYLLDEDEEIWGMEVR